jgi:hypothetical protein
MIKWNIKSEYKFCHQVEFEIQIEKRKQKIRLKEKEKELYPRLGQEPNFRSSTQFLPRSLTRPPAPTRGTHLAVSRSRSCSASHWFTGPRDQATSPLSLTPRIRSRAQAAVPGVWPQPAGHLLATTSAHGSECVGDPGATRTDLARP